MNFTKAYESPASFWRWGAYTTIGAVLRDNVFWMQGTTKICPNIWVVLLADSAVHRKSGPIIQTSKLINEVKNTKLIRGRSSIQAILDDLSASATDKITGNILRGGSAFLCADELASFFVSDTQLISLLTDIYDYREEWTSSLRSGKFKINNLCVSLLAASNETFLKQVYNELAVYGGLLGRTFMIKPDEYRPGNSFMAEEGSERYEMKPLVDSLKEIAKLKGRIVFSPEAAKEYNDWYVPLRESYKTKPDKTGVVQRLHTGVVKLAVIIGVDNNRDLLIKKPEIEESISRCMAIQGNYEAYAMSAGKSTEANAAGLLLTAMIDAGGSLTRKEFLFKHFTDVSAEALDKVIITLKDAGMIEESWTGASSPIACYTLTKKCREIFRAKAQGENKNGTGH